MIEGLISSYPSVFGSRQGDPTNSLTLTSEHFEPLLLGFLLWACLLPVLPKSGSSTTGSVGSQVRSYTGAVW